MSVNVEEPQKPKIRLSSHSRGYVTVDGFEGNEVDQFHSALLGLSWVRVGANGRLETLSAVQYLKGPAEDDLLLPFWRPVSTEDRDCHMQLELFEPEECRKPYSPSITITSLCGYNYTPERYAVESVRLERFGFECMRSRRGINGYYSESWRLPGLWKAKGGLKEAIDRHKGKSEKDQLYAATEFLRRNCSFGSLDVSIQRYAMVLD